MTKNSRNAAELQIAIEGILSEIREMDSATIDAAHLMPLAASLRSAGEHCAKIDAEIRQRVLIDGKALPGVSTGEAKTNRVWNDPEAAAQLAQEAFGDDAFDRKLKSPAGIEKLGPVGKAFAAMGSDKPKGAKTVVY